MSREDKVNGIDETHYKRAKQLKDWLDANTDVIPEPKMITLNSFEIDWDRWLGSFNVWFDDSLYPEKFHFYDCGTGGVEIQPPMFTSPLGVPASYCAVVITKQTDTAIRQALELTLPRLTPHGRNRRTGIETTRSTPIFLRLGSLELTKAKGMITSEYSISVQLPAS